MPTTTAATTTNTTNTTNTSPFTLRFVKKVLTSWYWWGFVGLWIIAGETESFSSNSLLALYMKSSPFGNGTGTGNGTTPTPYTVAQLNDYPTGVPAVGIVSTLFWATLTDFLQGKRYLVGYFIGVTGIATSAMVLVASHYHHHGGGAGSGGAAAASTRLVFAAYYWAGTVYACQATFFAWCNDAMRYEEDVFRGVVLAGMNLGSNAVNAWWSILFYGASMAPWFIVSQLFLLLFLSTLSLFSLFSFPTFPTTNSSTQPSPPPFFSPPLSTKLQNVPFFTDSSFSSFLNTAWYVGHDCLLDCPRHLVRRTLVVPPQGRPGEERRGR